MLTFLLIFTLLLKENEHKVDYYTGMPNRQINNENIKNTIKQALALTTTIASAN